MSRFHRLQTWREPFAAVWAGVKTAEIRKNDRDFKAGDTLILEEWDETTGEYRSRVAMATVLHVLPGGRFGLAKDYCMLSFRYPSKYARDYLDLDVLAPASPGATEGGGD